MAARMKLTALYPLAVGVLLVLMTLLGWSAGRSQSPSYDEPYHIGVGMDIWEQGRLRYEFMNTSFSRRWISFPLIFSDAQVPVDAPNQGVLANEFMYHNTRSAQELYAPVRAWMMLPLVLLALGVFFWARELMGKWGALLALACLAFDPNLLAASGTATTDLLFTAAFFWAAYAWWRLDARPSAGRAAAAGVLLAVALAAKFSGLALVPALGLAGLVRWLQTRDRQRLRWMLLAGLLGVGVLFAIEGNFELISLRGFAEEQAGLARKIVMDLPPWAQTPIPLLRYLIGFLSLATDYSGGRAAFLAGTLYPQGTPWYFPAAFLLKTPPGVLGLLALAAGLRLFRRAVPEAARAQPAGSRWFILLPLLVFTALVLTSKMNLGYRHLLPVVPFLYLWVGQIARHFSKPAVAAAAGLLLAVLVVENLAVYPHYRAYFTLLVGGPAQGYRYLVDSNLDWGQDLPGLADFQREHQIEKLYLGYFGSADPAAYGVRSECLPGTDVWVCADGKLPEHGWVAVSASCLQGYCTPFDRNFYAPLRAKTPAAMIGYSILVYHLP